MDNFINSGIQKDIHWNYHIQKPNLRSKEITEGINYFTSSSYQLSEFSKYHGFVRRAQADAFLSWALFLLI